MLERKQYTKAFKLVAIRQETESEKLVAVLARELGVLRKNLYRWKEELSEKGGADAFNDHGVRRQIQSPYFQGQLT